MPPECQWHQHPVNPTRKACVRQATGDDNLCDFHRAAAGAWLWGTKRFVVQHEFDTEPTYVYDREREDSVVEFSTHLPVPMRQKLASKIAEELNS